MVSTVALCVNLHRIVDLRHAILVQFLIYMYFFGFQAIKTSVQTVVSRGRNVVRSHFCGKCFFRT